eukprot:Awhi_evm1s1668
MKPVLLLCIFCNLLHLVSSSCWIVGTWHPELTCEKKGDSSICGRGWNVYSTESECCSSEFQASGGCTLKSSNSEYKKFIKGFKDDRLREQQEREAALKLIDEKIKEIGFDVPEQRFEQRGRFPPSQLLEEKGKKDKSTSGSAGSNNGGNSNNTEKKVKVCLHSESSCGAKVVGKKRCRTSKINSCFKLKNFEGKMMWWKISKNSKDETKFNLQGFTDNKCKRKHILKGTAKKASCTR